ncbi:MAG: flavodoxin domain-containing protein [Rhodobacter sp.]|uniref:flavodoxin domain-containing protein n=1 Tax=Pararhodobacter sp. TaxID=2127056 RepID=UPI001D8B5F0C|nr:flavodoxin domain-containing protein [Pararhodobacter sp.]MCB1346538.1 flavodoxin domain-containing protein [Paracoccaceae bacterium]MCC0074306.1 flavodoxin domain-containing protein [Rhodobacter sp.]HPD91637.1 flavodoxin domain-containing protein [Pararhodobacter sp.]
MQIAILYGTETGNAEMLAEDIAAHLSDHDVTVTNLCDFAPASFDTGTLYLIVTSTYGDGELPASAQPFGAAMAAQAPDLAGVQFAVFGMGDSEYPETFNFGGKRLEEMMLAAGATLLGARVTHDASGDDMADDLAYPWAEAVIALAEPALA